MSVTPKDVERIARLAALAVEPGALPALTRQIAGIIHYVSQLEAVDTAGASPPDTSPQTGPWLPLRSDEPRRALLSVPLDQIAPAFQDGLFLVPRLGGVGEDVPETGS